MLALLLGSRSAVRCHAPAAYVLLVLRTPPPAVLPHLTHTGFNAGLPVPAHYSLMVCSGSPFSQFTHHHCYRFHLLYAYHGSPPPLSSPYCHTVRSPCAGIYSTPAILSHWFSTPFTTIICWMRFVLACTCTRFATPTCDRFTALPHRAAGCGSRSHSSSAGSGSFVLLYRFLHNHRAATTIYRMGSAFCGFCRSACRLAFADDVYRSGRSAALRTTHGQQDRSRFRDVQHPLYAGL